MNTVLLGKKAKNLASTLFVSLLKLVGLVSVFVCVYHAAFAHWPRTKIEFSISPTDQSTLHCGPMEAGVYILDISCDVSSLPKGMKTAGFEGTNVQVVNWNATLTVSNRRGVLFSTNTLMMRHGSSIEGQEYFYFGRAKVERGDYLDVKLEPKEPCPLGPAPHFAITPGSMYYLNQSMNNAFLWPAAYAVAAGVAFILLVNFAKRLVNSFRSADS